MPAQPRPAFLITIDTEGDNLWSAPRAITTRNSAFLPRFQQLCERFALKPTWLTNWEMVECPVYREFAKDCLARGTAEIGMHLHAWNNPPIEPLTEDDYAHLPYLIQFPERVMRDKIGCITDRLEDVFGVKMLSHRAGRWAFNETYARLLVERGYRVDCSVSPHVRWVHDDGRIPNVVDYRGFPETAYFMDPEDISRAVASSPLLQLPVTILNRPRTGLLRVAERLAAVHSLPQRVLNRFSPTAHWLRPDGHNRGRMLDIVETSIREGRDFVEFMLHSSEFMPGGSPRFASERSIERLYDDLETLFETVSQRCVGLTLAEYRERVAVSPSESSARAA